MCDYAVGLSRQLNGSIIPSERKTIFFSSYYILMIGSNKVRSIISDEMSFLLYWFQLVERN
jgi:hypothetical protein